MWAQKISQVEGLPSKKVLKSLAARETRPGWELSSEGLQAILS